MEELQGKGLNYAGLSILILFFFAILGNLIAFHPLGKELSGIFIPIILFASAFSLGKLIAKEKDAIDIAVAIGLVAIYLLLLIEGALKLFYAIPLLLVIALPLIFLFRAWRETEIKLDRNLALGLPFLLLILPFSLLPPGFYDDLVYHLAIPNYYLIKHGIAYFPSNFFSNLPVLYELIQVPIVKFSPTPQVFNYLLVLLTGYSIYILARDSGIKGWLPALFALSLPFCAYFGATNKSDILVAFFIITGLRAFFSYEKGKLPLFVTGLLWGGALSVKYISIPAFLVFLALALACKRLRIREAGKILGISLLVFTPLLVKNYIITSNPVYPFLFGGKDFSPEGFRAISREIRGGAGEYPKLFKALIIGNPGGLGWIPGPVSFLLFLPLLLLKKTEGNVKFITLFSLSFLTIFPLISKPYLRYGIFSIFLLTIPAGFVVETFFSSRVKKLIVAVVLIVEFLFSLSFLLLLTNPGDYLSWVKGREEYLSRRLPFYRAYKYINQAPEVRKVLIIGEQRTFYLKKDFSTSLVFSSPYLPEVPGLKKEGFTHILFCPEEYSRLKKLYPFYYGKESTRRIFKLLHKAVPEKNFNYCVLYKLSDDPKGSI